MTTTEILWSSAQRAPGHYGLGQGKLAGDDDWINGELIRPVDTPKHILTGWTILFNYYVPGPDPDAEWVRGGHYSMLADNEGWVLKSTYTDAGGSPNNKTMQDEIFQIATDGSQKVRRITDHHSTGALNTNYYNQPRANISKDGGFVVWTSNWNGRRDVYLADIPSAP